MSQHTKNLAQHQFGTHADGYVSSPVHARGYSLTRLIELIEPQPGQRVLDLATGGGHTALAEARQGAWTAAGDLTMPMLRVAREFITAQLAGEDDAGPVTYAQLDAERLPFAPDSFDSVTCRIAAHHFPAVAAFVDECMRVVRPGGLVAVIDQLSPGEPKPARYINAFERLRDPSHMWAYNAEEWKGFFVGAGLDMVHYEEFETSHSLIAWAERMGNEAATISRLRAMLLQAPEPAAAWLKPHVDTTGAASFVIHQFLLIGRKIGADV
ncbi:MAG: methyltransferase domain-containing protein [Anaerolineae bacterium]|nr:methyltransferase domain-containing protein [Anaerolineae bacterium]